jgi:hypothetical protein
METTTKILRKTESKKTLERSGYIESVIKVLKPKKFVNFLTDLEITTDSVVVKVKFVTKKSTRRVFIDWGDLESDVISILPGLNLDLAPPLNGTNPLPDGTYEVFHAYQTTEEKVAFDRHITLRIQDNSGNIDQKSTTVTLTPKYKVNVYQTSVNLLDAADFGNGSAEFEITQTIDDQPSGYWEWYPSNNFFSPTQFTRLPGSQFMRIVELGGDSVFFRLEFTERDGFLNADDRGSLRGIISPFMVAGEIEKIVEVRDPTFGSCKVKVRYYVDFEVYKPLPSIGGMLTYAQN